MVAALVPPKLLKRLTRSIAGDKAITTLRPDDPNEPIIIYDNRRA